MATDFWASSHCKRWVLDRVTLAQARVEDLQYVDNPEHLDFLSIFFANLISKLCKKLQLRQRVIATATVFFKRFYVKNPYCETDPFIVAAACCYVASKAEESPVHIKNVVSEARLLFGKLGIKNFPSDNSKLAEMEFYLVDDLECDLTVFHPYRTLMTLCTKEGASALDGEAGELGAGTDAARIWGTGVGKLELQEGALQMAWFILNDTYRCDLPLRHPPHLLAVAALYLSLALHTSTRAAIQAHAASAPTRRSARASSGHAHAHKGTKPQDIVGFMAGLRVSMPLVAEIAQEIIALYTLWDRYREDPAGESARSAFGGAHAGKKRDASAEARGGSVLSGGPSTPSSGEGEQWTDPQVVTPAFLVHLLGRMREAHLTNLAHPASGRPVAVNKMLERAQAAG